MRSLPSSPVFTRADARAHEWSDPTFSRAVRAGRITRVRRGQYSAAPEQPLLSAFGAAAACAGSALSHRSALLVHGLPVIGTPQVAGEADERGKYDERSVLTQQKHRQEVLEDLPVVFFRWDGTTLCTAGRRFAPAACARSSGARPAIDEVCPASGRSSAEK